MFPEGENLFIIYTYFPEVPKGTSRGERTPLLRGNKNMVWPTVLSEDNSKGASRGGENGASFK
jgi:hypothetical protein